MPRALELLPPVPPCTYGVRGEQVNLVCATLFPAAIAMKVFTRLY